MQRAYVKIVVGSVQPRPRAFTRQVAVDLQINQLRDVTIHEADTNLVPRVCPFAG